VLGQFGQQVIGGNLLVARFRLLQLGCSESQCVAVEQRNGISSGWRVIEQFRPVARVANPRSPNDNQRSDGCHENELRTIHVEPPELNDCRRFWNSR
jgi:hypothetical protein